MSLVLVDTSVWIEMFQRGDGTTAKSLGELLHRDLICTLGLIRAEILSGAKSRKDYKRLQNLLSAIPVLSDPPELWDTVGWHRYRLARRGFQASVADLVIAATASYHRRPLFTLDTAFQRIKKVLPLDLFQPSIPSA